MASTRKRTTKSGIPYYEISVSRGRGYSRLTTRWYPPEGWSKRSIERELAKVAAEFEQKCKAGEVLTRKEEAAIVRQKEIEETQIKTLRQYCEAVFMPTIAIRCSENTRTTYQGNLNTWVYPHLGDRKMPEINAAQMSALLLDMQAKGKKQGTVLKVYTILQGIFKMAYMTDLIDRNPMDKVERPKARKDEVKKRGAEAYTASELQKILQSLEREPLKWRVLVRLLIDTGIRRGECCGLQWKDIDFRNNTISISGNLCYSPDKGIYLDTPKNGKERTIDVDPQIMCLLRKLRQEQAGKALSRYVFTQEGSPEPMHPQSPGRYLQKFSKRYGVPGLHPHKLRHSFASVAITNGADIASVSEKLGHTDKAVTLRMYTHADQESIKKASQIFRDAIKQA